MAKRMVSRESKVESREQASALGPRHPTLEQRASFNFQMIILDQRVAEELVARFIEALPRGFLVVRVEFNFQIFANMNSLDAAVTNVRQCVLDRLALRIEHG